MRGALKVLAGACLCVLLLTGTASAAFPDVRPGAWYTEAVTEMEEAGLLHGYPDGTFRPGAPITAAQFVAVTARCAGLSPVPGQTNHWAAGQLQAALQAGWYDWDEIPPTGERFDQPITRQLAVKILMRALLPQIRGDYNTESQKMRDFDQLDGRYYEICNEPNGSVTWTGDVKPYAQAVIPVIRERAPRSVILVGSPTWSQDIHLAAQSPLEGENLMYTLHFYAGTHGADLRRRIDDALAAGLPVFVSEWGTSRADGSGGVFLKEAGEWLDFLKERGISWANWSLCDKNETSAALRAGTSPEGTWNEADLSESGRFVFSRFAD